jgi:DNA-binding transcriptional LysR family regulator
MELRHLRYFIVLAEELNFRRAAERLEMAQPPLSKQIRDLELEIGSKLFERNQKRVLLTRAGKVFLKEVRLVMIQVDIAVTKAQQAHNGGKGEISIGFSAPAQQLLGKILSALKNINPELQVSIQELTGLEQLSAIKSERIDLGLGYLPDLRLIQRGGLVVQAIQPEKFYLALPASHPSISKDFAQDHEFIGQKESNPKIISPSKFDSLAAITVVSNDQEAKSFEIIKTQMISMSIEILKSEVLILPKNQWGDYAEIRILEVLHLLNIKPSRIQEVSNMEVALSLVQQNMGVTIISSAFKNFQHQGVCYIDIEETLAEREIGVIWRIENKVESLEELARLIKIEIWEKD